MLRSRRERARTTQYDPATGRTVPNNECGAAQNYFNILAEIDNEELQLADVTAK